jgi:signal transduction histidine kinase
MFRMLRYFSIASLVSILIAAALLTVLYRQVAITDIVRLGEINNIALSQAELNSVKPQLVEYLTSVTQHGGDQPDAIPLMHGLDDALQDIMSNSTVVRIKLHSHDGMVVYSTAPEHIGIDESGNAGFLAAIGGRTFSRLVYRDAFNIFSRATSDDNMVQTYIPVRQTATSPIVGVFEIYTDASLLVSQAEHAEWIILSGVAVIFLLLYVVLLLIVQRAERIISAQQETIRERTQTLETLSAQLLASEENEKKRIAGELHEGIAQTLAAIKINVEKTSHFLEQNDRNDESGGLQSLVPVIQGAIQDVRELAMELRPSSLDDLGLLPTLAWLFREFQSIYPHIAIEQQIKIAAQDIPAPLNIIIYRIVQEALHCIAKYTRSHHVTVRLKKSSGTIELSIVHNGAGTLVAAAGPAADEAGDSSRTSGMTTLRQRTVLSGGNFAIDKDAQGATTLRASWAC